MISTIIPIRIGIKDYLEKGSRAGKHPDRPRTMLSYWHARESDKGFAAPYGRVFM